MKRTWRRRYSEGSRLSACSAGSNLEKDRNAWSTLRSRPGTHVAPSSMAAAAELGVALEDAVERHAGEEALGRVVQHREVLGPQVLPATEPVLGPRLAVAVERLGEQLAAADVQHERHARLGEAGPDRIEIDVRRREVAGRVGRDPYGGDAVIERLARGSRAPASGR